MSSQDPQIDLGSRDDYIDLGAMTLGEKTAQLYVCYDLVIARFEGRPGGVQAQHMYRLTFESDVFLLAAFRLYLDYAGKIPMPAIDAGGEPPLEC